MSVMEYIDPEDTSTLPRELWLTRRNNNADISNASMIVSQYLPIPKFEASAHSNTSVTVVSALFLPPEDEPLLRNFGKGTFTRPLSDYCKGIQQMAINCQNLVLFLPRGELSQSIRDLGKSNIVVYNDFETPWQLPHLKDKRQVFYTKQLQMHNALRSTQSGEPHSWGCWNAKTYILLEAMRRDPFGTSHFAWLDNRTPYNAVEIYPDDADIVSGVWPCPRALDAMYAAMKHRHRGVVCCSYERGLCPTGLEFKPVITTSATSPDADDVAGIDDIISIGANIIIGDKGSVARLARAHLIMFERDFVQGMYVAREELQLSYAHYEFKGLYNTLELFRRRPVELPMKIGVLAYVMLGKADSDWSGLGLDWDPEEEELVGSAEATRAVINTKLLM